MEFAFRPAVRENVGLFIGLAGGTDSGKTWSAMELATGIVGPGNRFAVIDTENKRALHYADDFAFDVVELAAPYNPSRYEEAVQAAIRAGYKAIVVDSMSHEHDGHGGYLDMQATDLAERVERAMKKNSSLKEWDAIERLTPLSWSKPKRERKLMMYTMLSASTSIPIILCFRAEEKVFTSKDGKLVANNPPIWAPMCGKGMPFEMTVFFMLHREKKGVPVPIKLSHKYADLFPLDKPLTRESGRRIAEWARGTASAPQEKTGAVTPPAPAGAPADADPGCITPHQALDLEVLCKDAGVSVATFLRRAGVEKLEDLPATDYPEAVASLKRRAQQSGGEART